METLIGLNISRTATVTESGSGFYHRFLSVPMGIEGMPVIVTKILLRVVGIWLFRLEKWNQIYTTGHPCHPELRKFG